MNAFSLAVSDFLAPADMCIDAHFQTSYVCVCAVVGQSLRRVESNKPAEMVPSHRHD